MRPRILFIVPAEYDSLERKGVLSMIFDRDEEGFFERVVTVHPFARRTRKIELNNVHVIHEIGPDLLPGSSYFRFLRWIQAPVHAIRIVVKLYALIQAERINLVRATDPCWSGLFAWIATRPQRARVPFCVSIHADYDKRYELDGPKGAPAVLGSRRLARVVEKFTLSRAALVMPIRDHLGETAVTYGAARSVVRVIPHGIDMTSFRSPPQLDVRARFDISGYAHILSFVGRLSKENYVDDLLVLARKLGAVRDDFVMLLVGGGEEEERLQRLVEGDQKLGRFVRLLGFQSRDVAIVIRQESCVSLCLMAGFSLIEACAAGRPVVSYDVEWHSELVVSNQTGFLVKEHDIEGLFKSVTYLMDNLSDAERMGQFAQRLAFERHDIRKTSQIKKRWYSELLTASGSRNA